MTNPSLPPTEVDGWRVLPDPRVPGLYWRMRAFEVEAGVLRWGTWSRWESLSAASFREVVEADRHNLAARRAVWAELFVNP